MAGFGKRGVVEPRKSTTQPAGRTRKLAKDDPNPAPRIQSGNSLHWGKILPLTESAAAEVPEAPGVYALMSGKRESDMVFISGCKSLRAEFLKEIVTQASLESPHGRFLCCAETPMPYEQADKEIQIFRRRFGKKPLLNSGF